MEWLRLEITKEHVRRANEQVKEGYAYECCPIAQALVEKLGPAEDLCVWPFRRDSKLSLARHNGTTWQLSRRANYEANYWDETKEFTPGRYELMRVSEGPTT